MEHFVLAKAAVVVNGIGLSSRSRSIRSLLLSATYRVCWSGDTRMPLGIVVSKVTLVVV
jgi:hypothetical protein